MESGAQPAAKEERETGNFCRVTPKFKPSGKE
jgi:hypothetical protein